MSSFSSKPPAALNNSQQKDTHLNEVLFHIQLQLGAITTMLQDIFPETGYYLQQIMLDKELEVLRNAGILVGADFPRPDYNEEGKLILPMLPRFYFPPNKDTEECPDTTMSAQNVDIETSKSSPMNQEEN